MGAVIPPSRLRPLELQQNLLQTTVPLPTLRFFISPEIDYETSSGLRANLPNLPCNLLS